MIYEFNDKINLTLDAFVAKFWDNFGARIIRYESKIPLDWHGTKKFVMEGVCEVDAREFLDNLVKGNRMSEKKREQIIFFTQIPKQQSDLVNEILKAFQVQSLSYGGVLPYLEGEKILDVQADAETLQKIRTFLSKNYQVSFYEKDSEMAENKNVKVKNLVSDGQTVELVTVELPKNVAEFLKTPAGQIIASQIDSIIVSATQEAETERKDNELKIQGLNETIESLNNKIEKFTQRVGNLEEWTDNFKLPNRKRVEQPDVNGQAKK